MDDIMSLEIYGSVLLVTGIVLVLIWSFFRSEWWSAVFGFLSIFFLVEAIWHYCVADYKRIKKQER